MIEHDNEWLDLQQGDEKYHPAGDNYSCDMGMFASDYHEHMNRWRLLTEDPEQDQRIEIAHIAEFGDRLDSTITVYGSIHYEMLILQLGERSLVWRPAPLPTDEEIQALMESQ